MTDPTWMQERFEPTGSSIGFRITRKLDEVQSPFQKIEIYESTDWGNLMLIDGAMMLTTRDNFLYHEMMSHPALFTHDAPRDVVIIGGVLAGPRRAAGRLGRHSKRRARAGAADVRSARIHALPPFRRAPRDDRDHLDAGTLRAHRVVDRLPHHPSCGR